MPTCSILDSSQVAVLQDVSGNVTGGYVVNKNLYWHSPFVTVKSTLSTAPQTWDFDTTYQNKDLDTINVRTIVIASLQPAAAPQIVRSGVFKASPLSFDKYGFYRSVNELLPALSISALKDVKTCQDISNEDMWKTIEVSLNQSLDKLIGYQGEVLHIDHLAVVSCMEKQHLKIINSSQNK